MRNPDRCAGCLGCGARRSDFGRHDGRCDGRRGASGRRPVAAAAVALSALLGAACGGGSGGAPVTDPGALQTDAPRTLDAEGIALPRPVSGTGSALQPGVPGQDRPAGDGSATLVFASAQGAPSLTRTLPWVSTNHLDDAVRRAWAAGWTGRGRTIAVVDDLDHGSVILLRPRAGPLVIERDVPPGQALAAGRYAVAHEEVVVGQRGTLVAAMAGGAGDDGAPQASIAVLGIASVTTVSCAQPTCASVPADWGAYDSRYRGDAVPVPITVARPPGRARDASVVTRQADVWSTQDLATNLAKVAAPIEASADASVIALPLGTFLSSSGTSLAMLRAALARTPWLAQPSNAVVVIAAGDGGTTCAATDLDGCNPLAAVAALAPQTREQAIVAGALSASGRSIAASSARAGALAQRFLLAPGDPGERGTEGSVWAVARIAGAVALVRQRWPNLSAAQAADLLLLTADKDIDGDGTPDFSGVSAVYGHGKLDLSRALDPAGSAAVQP